MTFNSQFFNRFYSIDMEELVQAAEGGFTIALASSIYYSFYGLILGMSGIVGSVLKADSEAPRKLTIIAGLIFSSAFVYYMHQQRLSEFFPFDIQTRGSNLLLLLSGGLVGIGTQLGSGCTSGHGLCGLPRLSIRSIIAVLIFLTTSLVTATLDLHKLLPRIPQLQNIVLGQNINPLYYIVFFGILPLLLFCVSEHKSFKQFLRTVILYTIGMLFGFGLMLGGMAKRQKIYAFLELNSSWDPSLLVVLMSGVLFNLFTFNFLKTVIKKPLLANKLSDPRGSVDWRLVVGAFIFGLGWGLGGLCPGPFLLQLPLSDLRVPIFWGGSFLLHMKLTQFFTTTLEPKAQKTMKSD